MLIYDVLLFIFACPAGTRPNVLGGPPLSAGDGQGAAATKKGPFAGPLSSVILGGESLDDADRGGEGRGDRQAQRQQDGGGDLVEQALEAPECERHDTHLSLNPGGAGRVCYLNNAK